MIFEIGRSILIANAICRRSKNVQNQDILALVSTNHDYVIPGDNYSFSLLKMQFDVAKEM